MLYKDFEDLFFGINQEVLLNPDNYFCSIKGNTGRLSPLFLQSKSPSFNFDLTKLSYSVKPKMRMLAESYINVEEYKGIKAKLDECKGLSTTFYFKQHKPAKGTNSNNGPCLIAIVFSRMLRNHPWSQATVLYRTTELNRRFAADLAFLSMLFKEITPDLGQYNFFIPAGYVSIPIAATYLSLFGLTLDELGYNEMADRIENFQTKHLNPGIISGYKMIARMQRYSQGEAIGVPMDLTNAKISDFLRSNK